MEAPKRRQMPTARRAAKMTALMVSHQREVQALPEDSPRRKPTLPTLRFLKEPSEGPTRSAAFEHAPGSKGR